MSEKDLKKLYNRFLKFHQSCYFIEKKVTGSLEGLKITDKVLKEFFDNYEKDSFLKFFSNIKDIIYLKNIFDFISKNATDDWVLWYYLKFLKEEKIIKIKRNGKVSILKKEILKIIPKHQTEEEIKEKLERKLKIKIKEKKSVINLFTQASEGSTASKRDENSLSKKFQDFTVKAKWDQMPISVSSAIFVVSKILEKLPLNKNFLFVGDDDFVSVILGLINPNIESLVIDADEQLLDCLNILANKFKLKIKTKKVDIRKEKTLGEKFIGFLVNPVYTEAGVKEFIKYGISQLRKDGGFVFLEVGDEAIGSRFLFLQEFFAKNNLIIEEMIKNKIYYPYIMLHKEDKEILRKLCFIIDKRIIEKSPRLGASLYVFQYLPFKPKRVKFKKPIYAYL